MKNIKKVIIIICLSIVLIGGIIFGFYKIFKDKNSLTIVEKTWINNNKNTVFTINVPNDLNVFGNNGSGVFYDFINSIDEELELKLNDSVYSISTKNDSFGFSVDTNYDKRDLLIYTDYYVLVSKTQTSVNGLDSIKDNNVGILGDNLNYISTYYSMPSSIKTYDNSDSLFKDLNEDKVSYIIVPMTLYKDKIISNKYNISYFFNDAKIYYYLRLSDDKTLNSVVTKYYNKWMEDKYNSSYDKANYNLFIDSLGISDLDEDSLTDKDIKFEYIVSQPYQLLSRGNFSGIVNEYMESFNKFSNIEFNLNRVKKYRDFKYDISKKKIDLFFGKYNYNGSYKKINTNFIIDYYLISDRSLKLNVDSLKAFSGEVYVEENSLLYEYLSGYSNITTKTFNKLSNIKKLLKKGKVVLVDKLSYDNYLVDNLSGVDIVLENSINDKTYSFYYKNDSDIFYRLFSSYINTLNPNDIINQGLNNYFKTYETGSKTVKLAKYIILLIVVLLIGLYLFIKNKKKIVLNTKIKKNEKIRYVDILTSLKNRNYLNDRLEIWNQNTVYPQAIIVLDLNNIKYLNDTFGHEEGDKQIKAAANVLFKTQLENTELLRTDGNEFMVYLVGYSEKQVVSYIKKLIKEFKKLPYEYGVAIGFSLINDDLVLVEDAFNEATAQMRKNKSTFEGNDD